MADGRASHLTVSTAPREWIRASGDGQIEYATRLRAFVARNFEAVCDDAKGGEALEDLPDASDVKKLLGDRQLVASSSMVVAFLGRWCAVDVKRRKKDFEEIVEGWAVCGVGEDKEGDLDTYMTRQVERNGDMVRTVEAAFKKGQKGWLKARPEGHKNVFMMDLTELVAGGHHSGDRDRFWVVRQGYLFEITVEVQGESTSGLGVSVRLVRSDADYDHSVDCVLRSVVVKMRFWVDRDNRRFRDSGSSTIDFMGLPASTPSYGTGEMVAENDMEWLFAAKRVILGMRLDVQTTSTTEFSNNWLKNAVSGKPTVDQIHCCDCKVCTGEVYDKEKCGCDVCFPPKKDRKIVRIVSDEAAAIPSVGNAAAAAAVASNAPAQGAAVVPPVEPSVSAVGTGPVPPTPPSPSSVIVAPVQNAPQAVHVTPAGVTVPPVEKTEEACKKDCCKPSCKKDCCKPKCACDECKPKPCECCNCKPTTCTVCVAEKRTKDCPVCNPPKEEKKCCFCYICKKEGKAKSTKPAKSCKSSKTCTKSSKPAKTAKSCKSAKTAKTCKSVKTAKTCKSSKTAKSCKSTRTAKSCTSVAATSVTAPFESTAAGKSKSKKSKKGLVYVTTDAPCVTVCRV